MKPECKNLNQFGLEGNEIDRRKTKNIKEIKMRKKLKNFII